jgi:hypothetical protein
VDRRMFLLNKFSTLEKQYPNHISIFITIEIIFIPSECYWITCENLRYVKDTQIFSELWLQKQDLLVGKWEVKLQGPRSSQDWTLVRLTLLMLGMRFRSTENMFSFSKNILDQIKHRERKKRTDWNWFNPLNWFVMLQYLVDSTWGAGYVRNHKFVRSFCPYFFLTPPQEVLVEISQIQISIHHNTRFLFCLVIFSFNLPKFLFSWFIHIFLIGQNGNS